MPTRTRLPASDPRERHVGASRCSPSRPRPPRRGSTACCRPAPGSRSPASAPSSRSISTAAAPSSVCSGSTKALRSSSRCATAPRGRDVAVVKTNSLSTNVSAEIYAWRLAVVLGFPEVVAPVSPVTLSGRSLAKLRDLLAGVSYGASRKEDARREVLAESTARSPRGAACPGRSSPGSNVSSRTVGWARANCSPRRTRPPGCAPTGRAPATGRSLCRRRAPCRNRTACISGASRRAGSPPTSRTSCCWMR